MTMILTRLIVDSSRLKGAAPIGTAILLACIDAVKSYAREPLEVPIV
jgi:hypothetical protein